MPLLSKTPITSDIDDAPDAIMPRQRVYLLQMIIPFGPGSGWLLQPTGTGMPSDTEPMFFHSPDSFMPVAFSTEIRALMFQRAIRIESTFAITSMPAGEIPCDSIIFDGEIYDAVRVEGERQ